MLTGVPVLCRSIVCFPDCLAVGLTVRISEAELARLASSHAENQLPRRFRRRMALRRRRRRRRKREFICATDRRRKFTQEPHILLLLLLLLAQLLYLIAMGSLLLLLLLWGSGRLNGRFGPALPPPFVDGGVRVRWREED